MNDNKVVNGDAAVSGNASVGGDVLVRGNMTVEHGMKVNGWLDVDNMNFPAAGVFVSEAALAAAVTPKAGRIAGVITNSEVAPTGYVIKLYDANGTAWVDTGRLLDVSVKMILHTNIEVLDPEEFAEWQESVDDSLRKKANLADMGIDDSVSGKVTIELKPNVSAEVVTPEGIEDKLDKPTDVVDGNLAGLNESGEIVDSGIAANDVLGTNDVAAVERQEGDKVEIRVKDVVIATVLKKLGYGSNAPTAGKFLTTNNNGEIVGSNYDIHDIFDRTGLAMGMAVLAKYEIDNEGNYEVVKAGVTAMIKDDQGKVNFNGEGRSTLIHFNAGFHTVAIIFPDPTEIPSSAFFNITSLVEVHIPSWVHSIGDGAFSRTGLRTIKCECITPPTLGTNVFPDVSSNTTLMVHNIAKDGYGSGVWAGFNIENF